MSSKVSEMDLELPPTFGDKSHSKGSDNDVHMEPSHKRVVSAEDSEKIIEGSDDEEQIVNSSKAKFNKYLEDIRQREARASKSNPQISGTFGDGGNTFTFVNVHSVDPNCEVTNVTVLSDYSCTLIQEDVCYNQLSQIKVYKMQLLERSDKQKWTVWVAQGKISESEFQEDKEQIDTASFKTEIKEFYNRQDSAAHFEKRFFEKSGNKWAERDYFKEKGKFKLLVKGKFQKILKEASELESKLLEVIETSTSQFECKTNQDIVQLLAEPFNLHSMKKYMSDLGLDSEKLPIGKLTMDKIKRGHLLLNEIQRILATDDTKKQQNLIVALTNDFYCTIPHNFGMMKPPVIDHLIRVKEKTRMLELLGHVVETQQMLVRGLDFELRQKHPVDVFASDLCVKLTNMERDDHVFAAIHSSVMNTQSELHTSQMDVVVANIFEIYKPSEKLRFHPFDTKLHNKFMLWQGIRTHSLPSVLREGVRAPAIEAAKTGFMFGKGIYFTDCFSKATLAALPPGKRHNEAYKCYMLLSEVALGDMHKAFAPHQFQRSAPMLCHSVYGVGNQAPDRHGIRDLKQAAPEFAPNQSTFDKPNAVFLNTGKMQANVDLDKLPQGQNPPDLKFNDYVVFDDAQVKMRYLVECQVVLK